ncbi:MAG: PAS domain S-box protein, partial [Acidobacteria bacterium]|nr:PAS domain S-box protein [Acidobacteriota bacterium]
FGVMAVYSQEKGFYKPAHLEILKLSASQIALALARILRRQSVLHFYNQTDPWGLRNVITRPQIDIVDILLLPIFHVLKELISYDWASLQVVEEQNLRIVASNGFDNPREVRQMRFDLQRDFPNVRVYHERQILYWQDVRREFTSFSDPDYRVGKSLAYHPTKGRSWLGLPLLHRPSGEPVGVLALERFEPAFFTKLDAAKAAVIAPFIADRMVKAYEQLQHWIREDRFAVITLLNHYLSQLTETTQKGDSRQVLSVAAKLVADAFGVTSGFFIKDQDHFYVVAWALASGEEAIPPDPQHWPEISHPLSNSLDTFRASGSLCVPAKLNGRLVGYLCVEQKEADRSMSQEDISILRSVANLMVPHLIHGSLRDVASFESLLDVIKVGALIEDGQGIINFANYRLLALLGYSNDEIVNRHFLFIVAESQHEKVLAESSKRPKGIRSQYET